MMSCSELTTIGVFYDPWVAPHQLLPMIAVLIGMEWKDVVIIIYLWETIEVVYLTCLEISEREGCVNALLSDPIQGMVGILTAQVLMNVVGMTKPIQSNRNTALLWSALFILPGIPLIIGGEFVWVYIPIWVFCLVFMATITEKVTQELMTGILGHSVLVSVGVFGLKDYFNSFYIGIAAASLTILVALAYNRLHKF